MPSILFHFIHANEANSGWNIGELRSRVCSREFCLTFHARPTFWNCCAPHYFPPTTYPFLHFWTRSISIFPPFFSNIHSFFQNDRCRREARDTVVRYFRILKLKEWKKLEKLIREDIELKWKCSLSFEKNSTRNPFESCNSFKSLYHQIRTYKNILVKLPP